MTAITHQIRTITDSFAGAVLGTAVYALWAAYVNWDAGRNAALLSAATQWFISIIVTYYGFVIMRWCYGRSGRVRGGLQAFFGGLISTYVLALALHFAMGTPHILLTLAAGLIPNLVVSASYAWLLMHTESNL